MSRPLYNIHYATYNELTPNPLRNPHSPSLSANKVSENKEVNKWIENYLGVGEWVMDQSVAILAASSWFERKR